MLIKFLQVTIKFTNIPSIDTIGVFLDMSKVFDKVWHNGYANYGIQSNLLVLLKIIFLTERKELL